SGGCVPEQHLDTPVDYEAIAKVGAIMGSGGVIVMDENTCMVDMARFFMDFVQDESCGKCTPCREGSSWLVQTLQRIYAKKGQDGDIELLEDLCGNIAGRTVCAFGEAEVGPVLSTIKHWRPEYEALIREAQATRSTGRELPVLAP
ncbi:MAG: NADH-ubiquinone oxidoreductase-F iron-sulfur binding region domain-containing protein, partial [Saprospiraceae bacterium]|nr:NADH-ubiquinone oxidoreductase-F iron-sulfur binding region domain-containing protein [Saprospiraceae bacterium]